MSTNIDQKVVEMQFNNKNFESNVATSMSTLEKLKNSLKFDGATKGIENVEKSFNKFDSSKFASAIESIQNKFSVLEVVAISALNNIVNRAVDAGIKIVKSLSIDQVTEGWSKYEKKTASVQTLLNSTGKTLDEVNSYLDQLMWYSDETSYGFTDMTAALATMTSSGGDIEKLIPMIEGVANATAFAGKGAAEFSRVMYNLNQSYSAGSLQYIDWKSIEQAGAASAQLKQTIIDTAVALGKINEGEVSVSNFAQSLKDKWADREVMEAAFSRFSELTAAAYKAVRAGEFDTASEAIEALSKDYDELASKAFRSAQEAKSFREAIEATKDAVSSSWMKIFDTIFGNYEEQRKLWTELANRLWESFVPNLEELNEFLTEWRNLDSGGRNDLIQSFWNLYEAISSLIKPIKEAFQEIFPPITAKRLSEIILKVKDFTESLVLTEEKSYNLRRLFKGLFSILDVGKQAFTSIIKPIKTLISIVSPVPNKIFKIILTISDWIVKLNDFLKQSDFFNKKVTLISNKIKYLLVNVFDYVREKFFSFMIFLKKNENTIIKSLDTVKKYASTFLSYIIAFSKKILNIILKLYNSTKDKIKSIVEYLKKNKDSIIKIFDTVKKYANTFISFAVSSLKNIITLLKNNKNTVINIFNSIKKGITIFINFTISSIKNIVNFIKKNKDTIIKIFNSIISTLKRFISFTISSVKSVISFIKKNKDTIINTFKTIKEYLTTFLSFAISSVKSIITFLVKNKDSFIGIFNSITSVIKNIFSFVKRISPSILSIAKQVGNIIIDIINIVLGLLNSIDLDSIFYLIYNGISTAIQVFWNLYNAIRSYIKPIKEAFYEIFSPDIVKIINDIMLKIQDFTKSLILNEEQSENLKRIFKGLFALIDIGRMAILSILKPLKALHEAFAPIREAANDALLKLILALADFFVALRQAIINNDTFNKSMDKLSKAITRFSEFVKKKVESLISFITKNKDKFEKIKDALLKIFNVIKTKISSFISFISKNSGKIGDIVKKIYDPLKEKMESFISFLKDHFSSYSSIDTSDTSSFFEKIEKIFSPVSSMFEKMGTSLKNVYETISGVFSPVINAIGNAFKSIWELIKSKFEDASIRDIIDLLKAITKFLGKAGIAAILFDIAKAVHGLASIPNEIRYILDEVGDVLDSFSKKQYAYALLTIAKSVALLVASILVLTLLDPKAIEGAFIVLTSLFFELFVMFELITKFESSFQNTTTSLIALSAAIFVLSASIKDIAKIGDPAMIWNAVGAVGALFALIFAFEVLTTKVLKGSNFIGGSNSLLILSLAILVLVQAIKKISEIGDDAFVGALVIAGLIGALAFFEKNTNLERTAAQSLYLLSIATVISKLYEVMSDISKMGWNNLAIGFLGLFGIMELLIILQQQLQDASKLIKLGTSMILISAAMLVISEALVILSKIDFDVAVAELIAFGIFIAGIILLASKINNADTLIKISASLILISAALAVLGLVLNNVSLENMLGGIAGLAVALAVLAVAGYALEPVILTIVSFATALAEVGVAAVLFGAGLALISIGLDVFARSAIDIVDAILMAIKKFILAIPQFFADLYASLIEAKGTIVLVMVELFDILSKTFKESIPTILENVGELIMKVLELLVEYVPKIIDTILKLIYAIYERIDDIIGAIFDLVIYIINGLADQIREKAGPLREALRNLGSALIDAFFTFIFGEDLWKKIKGVGGDIIESIKQGIKDGWEKFKEIGPDIVTGLIEGIGDGIKKVGEKAKEIGGKLLGGVKDFLGINSPSKEFIKIGKYVDEGLTIGLTKYSEAIEDSAKDVGETTIDSLAKPLSKIADIIDSDIDYEPTIRPVMDLSDIQNGTDSMNAMLRNMDDYSISGSISTASKISSSLSSRSINPQMDAFSELGNTISKMLGQEPTKFDNTFNITSNDPKEVANEVSRIIQKQVERRNYSWA